MSELTDQLERRAERGEPRGAPAIWNERLRHVNRGSGRPPQRWLWAAAALVVVVAGGTLIASGVVGGRSTSSTGKTTASEVGPSQSTSDGSTPTGSDASGGNSEERPVSTRGRAEFYEALVNTPFEGVLDRTIATPAALAQDSGGTVRGTVISTELGPVLTETRTGTIDDKDGVSIDKIVTVRVVVEPTGLSPRLAEADVRKVNVDVPIWIGGEEALESVGIPTAQKIVRVDPHSAELVVALRAAKVEHGEVTAQSWRPETTLLVSANSGDLETRTVDWIPGSAADAFEALAEITG
jgi:hypothetical protein